jgi:hypothetical protein
LLLCENLGRNEPQFRATRGLIRARFCLAPNHRRSGLGCARDKARVGSGSIATEIAVHRMSAFPLIATELWSAPLEPDRLKLAI